MVKPLMTKKTAGKSKTFNEEKNSLKYVVVQLVLILSNDDERIINMMIIQDKIMILISSNRNDLFFAPLGTCLFWFNQRILSQSSGSSWKMFAATRISSSDDQYTFSYSVDQYIGNLNQLPQIVMWFTHREKINQQLIWMRKTPMIVYYHIMMCDTSLCDGDILLKAFVIKTTSKVLSPGSICYPW